MGRDKHEKRRRHSKRKFVQIWHEVIQSPAYQSLSVYAKAALIEICDRYNGTNNGRISFSVREIAERLHTGRHQAHRAMADLEEHGLAIRERLGWFSPDHGHATEWRITFQPTEKPATNEYRTWKPPEPKKQNPVAGAALLSRLSGDTSAPATMNYSHRSGDTRPEATGAAAGTHVDSSHTLSMLSKPHLVPAAGPPIDAPEAGRDGGPGMALAAMTQVGLPFATNMESRKRMRLAA